MKCLPFMEISNDKARLAITLPSTYCQIEEYITWKKNVELFSHSQNSKIPIYRGNEPLLSKEPGKSSIVIESAKLRALWHFLCCVGACGRVWHGSNSCVDHVVHECLWIFDQGQ